MRISEKEHAELTVYSAKMLGELKTITQGLVAKGKFDDGDVKTLNHVSSTLKKMRILNIYVGWLGGLSGKKLAQIHGVSQARISQILKEAKSGAVYWDKL